MLDDLLAASWHPAFVASFVLLGIIAGAFMILARYTPLLVAPGAYMLFILTLPFIAESEDVLMYSLDPNDPAYNASLIVVKFADGKVSSAKFLPD